MTWIIDQWNETKHQVAWFFTRFSTWLVLATAFLGAITAVPYGWGYYIHMASPFLYCLGLVMAHHDGIRKERLRRKLEEERRAKMQGRDRHEIREEEQPKPRRVP
jgi:hypothetical protein